MIPVEIISSTPLHEKECWPTELPAIPSVGSYIESMHEWITINGTAHTELRVERVTYKYSPSLGYDSKYYVQLIVDFPSDFDRRDYYQFRK